MCVCVCVCVRACAVFPGSWLRAFADTMKRGFPSDEILVLFGAFVGPLGALLSPSGGFLGAFLGSPKDVPDIWLARSQEKREGEEKRRRRKEKIRREGERRRRRRRLLGSLNNIDEYLSCTN